MTVQSASEVGCQAAAFYVGQGSSPDDSSARRQRTLLS